MNAMQLELFQLDAESLQQELETHSGLRIALAITDNRSTMISIKPSRNGLPVRVRLHQMFLSANSTVIAALGTWVKSRQNRRAAEIIDRFISENRHAIRKGSSRQIRICTLGTHFDLRALFDEINKTQFDGRITAQITWGRMPGTSRRRSIRFGSYYPEDHLIRIHPSLDQAFVPVRFVKYIVFHEMLHADLGIAETESGRRSIHNRTFRQQEKAYPDYAWAVAWQQNPANLRKLLRTRAEV